MGVHICLCLETRDIAQQRGDLKSSLELALLIKLAVGLKKPQGHRFDGTEAAKAGGGNIMGGGKLA